MKEYFSHDYHARADENIIKLLRVEGWAGYGLYWALIEMLYEGNGSIVKDFDLLAYEMRTQCERIKAVCEGFELFYEKGGRIYSKSVQRRLEERAEKSVSAKKSAIKRWADHANAMRTHTADHANAGVLKESKGKESKEKNTTTAGAVLDGKKPVNWGNCKSDLQSMMAYYIRVEQPEVYKNGTQAQVNALFKRYGRAASELLTISGDLPTAKRVFDLSAAHYAKKGLSWNLSTVVANAGDFLNVALGEKRNVCK